MVDSLDALGELGELVVEEDELVPEGPVESAGPRGTASTAKRRWPRYLKAALGLRNYWYPAFFSAELAEGQTRAEEIGGERIIFKRIDGTVYAMEDRCLHRGVAFSVKPQCHTKNTITCWLHGFTFDVRDGKLVQVITDPECNLIGRVRMKTYQLFEAGATVFVWIGDQDPVPPLEDLPTRLASLIRAEADGRRVAWLPHMRIRIAGDWRMGAENAVDNSHFYGHQQALMNQASIPFPLAMLPKKSDVEFRGNPGEPPYIKVFLSRSQYVTEAEIAGVTIRSTAPPGSFASRDPRGGVSHFLPGILQHDEYLNSPWDYYWEWYVPINEDYHMFVMLYAQEVASDADEEEWRVFMGKLFPGVWSTDPMVEGFQNFDGFVREQSHHPYNREDWFDRARHYRPDVLITEWRRFVEQHARDIQRRGRGWEAPAPLDPPQIVWDTQGRHLPEE